MSRHRLAIALGVIALLIPVLMWVDFLVFGGSRHGYNLLTGAASQLGAAGTPHAALFTATFFYGGGLLTFLLGLGLLRLSGNVLWRFGSLTVVLAGVLLGLTGYFPAGGVSAHVSQLHGSMSQICFAVAATSPLVLTAGASGLRVPANIRRFWLGSGAAAIVIEISAVILRGRIHFPEGLFQRPFLGALSVWFVAAGIWLTRHHQHTLRSSLA